MHLTQRQINTFLFLLLLITALAAFADVLTRESEQAARVGYGLAILCVGALLIAYRRGWEPARYVMSLATTLLVALFTVEPYVSQQMDLLHALPIVIALVLTGPRWVLLNATLLLVILLIRGEWSGVYTRPVNLAAYVALAGGMVLSRLAVDDARRLEEARQATEQERQRAIDALALAQQRADELEQRNAEQEQLLQLVSDLEIPAITIADSVMLAPLVGRLDTRRAELLNRRLLETATRQKVRLVVIDIAGVTHVDEKVARYLIQSVQALRLVGRQVAISGISPAVATTLASLGVTFPDVIICRSPQEALTLHL